MGFFPRDHGGPHVGRQGQMTQVVLFREAIRQAAAWPSACTMSLQQEINVTLIMRCHSRYDRAA